MNEILSVKLDFLFKLLFGDERNVDILAGFLSAILDIPQAELAEIQILDTALKKEHEEDKLGILDVNLKTKVGIRINIEIQVINKRDYEKRAVYYTGKRLIEQLSEGDPYTKLNQTVSINIIDFDLFPSKKYHNVFWLTEETEGFKLTDVIRIDFLELKKARHSPTDGMKQLWMDFLNAESEDELKMLAQKSETFERPVAEVIRLSGNAAVRAEYEARQKAVRDRIAEIALGEERGEKRGRAEGRIEGLAEGRIEGERSGIRTVAGNMKRRGVPVTQIAEDTGLSVDEIETLI